MKHKRWLVAGALASALVVLIAIGNGCSSASQQPVTVGQAPASSPALPVAASQAAPTALRPQSSATRPLATATPVAITPEPQAQPTAAPPVLARGSTGFFDIVVSSIDYAQAYASHSTTGKLCIIPLTVTNSSPEDRVFVASDVYLLDGQNHRYRAIHSEGWDARLPAGASAAGTLVFDLAGEAIPQRLVFTDSSHLDQNLLSLDLQP